MMMMMMMMMSVMYAPGGDAAALWGFVLMCEVSTFASCDKHTER